MSDNEEVEAEKPPPNEAEQLAAAESAALQTNIVDLEYMNKGFKAMDEWFQAVQEMWRAAWHPGNYVVIDEIMGPSGQASQRSC